LNKQRLAEPVPMTVPYRERLSRARGWRMPPGTKKVDRTTWFGNPFEVDVHGTRTECIAMFEALITGQRPPDNARQAHRAPFIRTNVGTLRGCSLACWCPLTCPDGSPCPCHADVLLKLANTDWP
jgi:hypothetical protein